MLTYTSARNLFASLTNNSSTTNLTLGDLLINNSIRRILSAFPWYFLYTTGTVKTVADQQSYLLPNDLEKIQDAYITIGTTVYPIPRIDQKQNFDILGTNQKSNIPSYYLYFDRKIYLWPVPSTADLTVTINYKKKIVDLDTADYTTGTVTLTNGSTTVTGAGTTFTADMVGRWIKSTDRQWYKIATFTSTTVLVLDRAYEGTTVAGATYLIGQIPLLPEDFQILAVYEAVMNYWAQQGEVARMQTYQNLLEETYKNMKREYGSQSTKVGVNDFPRSIDNPNLYITA